LSNPRVVGGVDRMEGEELNPHKGWVSGGGGLSEKVGRIYLYLSDFSHFRPLALGVLFSPWFVTPSLLHGPFPM